MFSAAQSLKADNDPIFDALLLSGGDARLALDPASGLNIYGCAPRPRGDIDDFSSSTASTISTRAYARAETSWHRISRDGGSDIVDALAQEAREELKAYFELKSEVDIVFAASGTDAQLLTLFLVRAMLGAPLVSVIVGADQTGSGTAYTGRGLHFTGREGIRKGDEVEGLSDGVCSIAVPFCDAQGNPRALADLDGAVADAVESAIAGGAHVMLWAMASSKLGWAAPSRACMQGLVKRWPDKVRIVVDACQMRISPACLRDYLAQGYFVLSTGSKFFCGPPFSGALLIPQSLRNAIAAIDDIAPGLKAYSSKFDWPSCWPKLRAAFSDTPNLGQYLRWQAALEEIRAYHAVPPAFRIMALRRFAAAVPRIIAVTPWVNAFVGSVRDPDLARDAEFAAPTIFSFTLRHPKGHFSRAQCAIMHRVLNQDISSRLAVGNDSGARRLAARRCHIGQPVAVGSTDAAVLRISSSARLVTRCWSIEPDVAAARLANEIEKVETIIQKMALVAQNFSVIAT
jgi:hypothetical protein